MDKAKEFFFELNEENNYLKNAVDQLRPIEEALIGRKPATVKLLQQKLILSPDKMTFLLNQVNPFMMFHQQSFQDIFMSLLLN